MHLSPISRQRYWPRFECLLAALLLLVVSISLGLRVAFARYSLPIECRRIRPKPPPSDDDEDVDARPEFIDWPNNNANCGLLASNSKHHRYSLNRLTEWGQRIIGGHEARRGEFPWLVALFNGNGEMFCAGSLISEQIIISAAHCFDEWPSSSDDNNKNITITVRTGMHKRPKRPSKGFVDNVDSWEDETQKILQQQQRKVVNIIVHDKYDRCKVDYDIGLAKLDRPVQMNDRYAVGTICLPNKKRLIDQLRWGRQMTVVGWGMTRQWRREIIKANKLATITTSKTRAEEEGHKINLEPQLRPPVTLQKVAIPIEMDQTCQQEWGSTGYRNETQFCAGEVIQNNMTSVADSCSGDSGGPLMMQEKSITRRQRWYLHGLVSYGDRHCMQKHGVYTRVSAFLPWIAAKMKELQ